MIKKFIFAIVLFSATPVFAWNRGIVVEWDAYQAPTDIKVKGFKLYKGNTEVCMFMGDKITKGTCNVEFTINKTPFKLSAVFEDNTESPKSNEHIFVSYYIPRIRSLFQQLSEAVK